MQVGAIVMGVGESCASDGVVRLLLCVRGKKYDHDRNVLGVGQNRPAAETYLNTRTKLRYSRLKPIVKLAVFL